MAEIQLLRGETALIDDADIALVAPYRWRRHRGARSEYAVTGGGQKKATILMHRLILGISGATRIDHVNGDRLDNRRCNLRICTNAQNAMNRGKPRGAAGSQFKGVYKTVTAGRWRAAIHLDYRQISLGTYGTETEAARAYDEAARHHFGPFARLNFPEQNNALPDGLFFKPQESSECETNRSADATMESAA